MERISSLLEGFREAQAKIARGERKPRPERTEADGPTFLECETHGPYQVSRWKDGREWFFAGGCPKCARGEDDMGSRLIEAGAEEALAGCSFVNFKAKSERGKNAVSRCQRFVEMASRIPSECLGIFLEGNIGAGKSHLSVAIAREFIAKGGGSVRIVEAGKYLSGLWDAPFEAKESYKERFVCARLLVLEELGRHANTEASMVELSSLINSRYARGRPTVFTSNMSSKALVGFLGEAAADRMTQKGNMYAALKWDSYRQTGRAA